MAVAADLQVGVVGAGDFKRISLLADTTSGRLLRVCGNIGTRQTASKSGVRIGPPPDNE